MGEAETGAPEQSGRPGQLPGRAPTDPDVRISRIRLLVARFRYAALAPRPYR